MRKRKCASLPNHSFVQELECYSVANKIRCRIVCSSSQLREYFSVVDGEVDLTRRILSESYNYRVVSPLRSFVPAEARAPSGSMLAEWRISEVSV